MRTGNPERNDPAAPSIEVNSPLKGEQFAVDGRAEPGNGHGGGTSSLLREAALQRRTSRRNVLFRAGAAAVASVGALTLLDQRRAEAITGGNFILGNSNDANAPSVLVPTAFTSPNPLLFVDGTRLNATATSLIARGPGGGVGVTGLGVNTTTTTGIAILGSAPGGAWALVGQSAAAGYDVVANGTGRVLLRAVASGPPAFASNNAEFVRDVQGVEWMSNGAGGWYPTQIGGLNIGAFSAVVTTQRSLPGSNGVAWTDMDATNLHIQIIPKFHCQAFVSVNVDLWTNTAGFNQDIGVRATSSTAPPGVGLYPTTALQPEAWKESGGFAGTFSPNAAFLETVLPMRAGVTYDLYVVWKTNKPAPSTAVIFAGAGPIGGKFSPTRMSVRLVTDSHSNVGAAPVQPPAKPVGRKIQ